MSDTLPDWRTVSEDDLIRAFRAEVALPTQQQPKRNCAVFELAYRALALCHNLPFTVFDEQYRRLLIKWLRSSPQADIAIARMDNGIEDLITNTYMCIFRSWKNMTAEDFYDKFDGQPTKIFSYLQITCSSVVVSVARKRAIDALPLEDEIAMRSYTPDEWLTSRPNALQRISQLLNPQERTILRLYLHGYAKDEIAAQIDKTVSHVRQKLKKILLTLQNDADLRELLGD
ncbi:MAG: RNA polymerase sigma factor [Aggregatilineales bacterium]